MSRHVIARDQFYQAFTRISTASDNCWSVRVRVSDNRWSEKAWVRGYVLASGQECLSPEGDTIRAPGYHDNYYK